MPDIMSSPVVHVVDDDPVTRTAMSRLLTAEGYSVRAYEIAGQLLPALRCGEPGCVVLDVHLPGMSGYDVQRTIADGENPLPVIFLTGYATIRDTVHAIQHGAIDFLTKPVDGTALIGAVSRAIARDADERKVRQRQKDLRSRYERLTPREREVLEHLLSGQLNKQAAADLQVAERTIKLHRAHILEKLEIDSMAGLTRIGIALGIVPPGPSK